jgi:hypothetical protein
VSKRAWWDILVCGRSRNCFIFLDETGLNPIELAFYKLKSLAYKAATGTIPAMEELVPKLLEMFTPKECQNYLRKCG